MNASIRTLSACVLLAVFASVASALAQNTPRLEGTIAYQVVHVSDRGSIQVAPGQPPKEIGSNWYDVGVHLDGAYALSRALAVLGEVSWGRAKGDDFDSERTRAAFNSTTAGAGLRYNLPRPTLRPYAQVVLGWSRDTFDPRTCVLFASCVGVAYTTNSFLAQPGAGVVWAVAEHWGVVGQADYRRVFSGKLLANGEEGFNAFRLAIGIRFMSSD